MFKSLCSKSYILLKKTFNFFFSYSGTINSGDFWISMILLSYLGQILERYNIYNIILLIIFYSVLALIQKRCRDIGYKGTFCVFLITMCAFYLNISDIIQPDIRKLGFGGVLLIVIGLWAYLGLMPSSKEKDLTLTSPLLKHPNAYFVVCIALFFVGRYVLQNWYL